MDQMTSTAPFQPPPSCGTLGFAFPPQAPQLSPQARWEGGCDKGPSQTPPRGFTTKQQPPAPQQPMADTVTRDKSSFYCGHQGRGPGVTAVQPPERNQHLQRQRQKALLNPERQEEAGFCCPLFGEHRLRGPLRGPQERVIAGIDYGMPAAPSPHA